MVVGLHGLVFIKDRGEMEQRIDAVLSVVGIGLITKDNFLKHVEVLITGNGFYVSHDVGML